MVPTLEEAPDLGRFLGKLGCWLFWTPLVAIDNLRQVWDAIDQESRPPSEVPAHAYLANALAPVAALLQLLSILTSRQKR